MTTVPDGWTDDESTLTLTAPDGTISTGATREQLLTLWASSDASPVQSQLNALHTAFAAHNARLNGIDAALMAVVQAVTRLQTEAQAALAATPQDSATEAPQAEEPEVVEATPVDEAAQA